MIKYSCTSLNIWGHWDNPKGKRSLTHGAWLADEWCNKMSPNKIARNSRPKTLKLKKIQSESRPKSNQISSYTWKQTNCRQKVRSPATHLKRCYPANHFLSFLFVFDFYFFFSPSPLLVAHSFKFNLIFPCLFLYTLVYSSHFIFFFILLYSFL